MFRFLLPTAFEYLFSAFRIRVLVHKVVSTKYFEMAVMIVICLSSISLAAEDPVDDSNVRNYVLGFIDYAFTGVFTVEMVLKVWTPYRLAPALSKRNFV